MSFFAVHHLTAGYGKNPVVRDLSFSLDRGCLLGILGANGSGKTTLLKAVCGILPHTRSCPRGRWQGSAAIFPRKAESLSTYLPLRWFSWASTPGWDCWNGQAPP